MIAHYNAVKSRLVAALPAAVTVEDTAITNADGTLKRGQYVILFGGGPDRLDDDRLSAPQTPDSDAEYVYTVRAVSVTAAGCMGVAQLVIGALVGFKPIVPGRDCRIELDDADDVQPDSAVRPPLFYADLTFILYSSRA